MDFQRALIGQKFGPFPFSYRWQDVALYALACGASADDLDFLLENRGPNVLPSFSVVPVFEALKDAVLRFGGNPLTLVHGAQKCVLLRPLPAEGHVETFVHIRGLYDRKSGALALFDTETFDQQGHVLFHTSWQIFYRGQGGFGGDKPPEENDPTPPANTPATHVALAPTTTTQALLYRLASGDMNPIHSDPDVAKAVGFPQPILHGLCTFGSACLQAVKHYCPKNPAALREMTCRFTKPVFPGETLEHHLWPISSELICFRTDVRERQQTVLNLGSIKLTQ